MHVVTAQLELSLKQVFEDIGAEVSDVRTAINGRPAGVHEDRARSRIARLEFFEFARVGVKKTNRHFL